MNSDILKRLRDALERAAGEYGQPTDEQRNEWLGLVKEVDEHDWFVTSTVADPPEMQHGEVE